MPDITINPANGKLTTRLEVTTPQVIGYEIVVYDTDQTTELAHYPPSDSQKNNPYLLQLPNAPSYYHDKYITALLSIVDPNGIAGLTYSVTYSIRQQGADLDPIQTITGKTTTGKVNDFGVFHIQ